MKNLRTNVILKGVAFLLLPICFFAIVISVFSIDSIYSFGYRENTQYSQSMTYETALIHEASDISEKLYPNPIENLYHDDTASISYSTLLLNSNPKKGTQVIAEDLLPSSALNFWYWPNDSLPAYTNDEAVKDRFSDTQEILENYDYVYDFNSSDFLKYGGGQIQNLTLPNLYAGTNNGIIAFSVKDKFPEGSTLALKERSYQSAEQMIPIFYTVAVSSGILLISLLLYLVYACGYRTKKESSSEKSIEGPLLTPFDSLPLDVIAPLVLAMFALIVYVFFVLFDKFVPAAYTNDSLYLIPQATLAFRLKDTWPILSLPYFGLLIVQTVALSVIRHIKTKTLLKSFLSFRLLQSIWEGIRKIVRKLINFLHLFIGADSKAKFVRLIAFYFLGGIFLIFFLSAVLGLGAFVFLCALFVLFPLVYLIGRQWRSLNAIAALEWQMSTLRSGDFKAQASIQHMPLEYVPLANELGDIRGIIKDAVERDSRNERLKTELITNVSHDLRTPLTSIINYIDLLKQEPLGSPKANEYLQILDNKSARLRTLTEDLIDASKALSGNLSYHAESINLPEMLRQQVGEYSERFKERQLEVVLRLPENMQADEQEVLSDPRHLSRILDNILSNASKYALTGSRVYLSLRQHTNSYEIEVKNISAERLEKDLDELFERFVRGDESRSTSSSGLGLSIARSLAEQIGATLEIRLEDDLFVALLTLPSDGYEVAPIH